MSNNTYGYVVVRWEVEPAQKPGEYRSVSFTVLDSEKRKQEKYIGALKYYGEKMPKDFDKKNRCYCHNCPILPGTE